MIKKLKGFRNGIPFCLDDSLNNYSLNSNRDIKILFLKYIKTN